MASSKRVMERYSDRTFVAGRAARLSVQTARFLTFRSRSPTTHAAQPPYSVPQTHQTQWKNRPASITIVWPVVLSVRAKVTT
jgi:hypothetical protein